MARASDQFRQSDVTVWSILAIACGAVALLSANISAAVPENWFASLHASRVEGANLSLLRERVAELEGLTLDLRRADEIVATRLSLSDQSDTDVTRRVGALELSLPRIMEALRAEAPAAVDRTVITAAIGAGQTQSFAADGGSVVVTQQPFGALPALDPATDPLAQPLPEIIGTPTRTPIADGAAYGVAIGPAVAADAAPATWDALNAKLGPLLFGLGPLVADDADSSDKRVVAGPFDDLAEATALCTRLERIGITCLPVPFSGTAL
ncbi:MAG: hypothetical protein JWR75_535 [Devosia sp.]|nr:hypothetical protein [Devosia sp.]